MTPRVNIRAAILIELAQRKAAGAPVTQTELARRSGVDQGKISRFLAGKSGARERTIERLLAALDLYVQHGRG